MRKLLVTVPLLAACATASPAPGASSSAVAPPAAVVISGKGFDLPYQWLQPTIRRLRAAGWVATGCSLHATAYPQPPPFATHLLDVRYTRREDNPRTYTPYGLASNHERVKIETWDVAGEIVLQELGTGRIVQRRPFRARMAPPPKTLRVRAVGQPPPPQKEWTERREAFVRQLMDWPPFDPPQSGPGDDSAHPRGVLALALAGHADHLCVQGELRHVSVSRATAGALLKLGQQLSASDDYRASGRGRQLLWEVEQSPDAPAALRSEAFEWLLRSGGIRSDFELTQRLSDPTRRETILAVPDRAELPLPTRVAAVTAWAQSDARCELTDALGRWLTAPEPEVRLAAVAMAAGCPGALDVLEPLRGDVDPTVQVAAVRGLCKTPGERSAAAALDLLESGGGGKERGLLVRCASPAGYAPVVPFLTECLRDLGHPLLTSCMGASKRVGDRRHLPLLRKIGKKHTRKHVRELARRLVREFGKR